jgi:chromosomal replication initiation ATPase DnaA
MTPILETKLIEQALTQAKTQLKAQATNEVFFNEFVLPLTLVQISGNTLVLEAKNLFAQQILTNDYAVSLVSAINTILKSNFQIKFIVKGATVGSLHSDNVHNDNFVNPSAVKARSINPNYIFDNFIVSEFNKAAYNAAQSLFKQKF